MISCCSSLFSTSTVMKLTSKISMWCHAHLDKVTLKYVISAEAQNSWVSGWVYFIHVLLSFSGVND